MSFEALKGNHDMSRLRRDIEYLYTVEIVESDGTWRREQIKATSMVEISRELKVKMEQLRYITKEVVR